jgi:hypothetical protein
MRGRPRVIEAMFQAVEQQMRPILMMTLSACIGLLPAAVSTGIGSQVHGEVSAPAQRRPPLDQRLGVNGVLAELRRAGCDDDVRGRAAPVAVVGPETRRAWGVPWAEARPSIPNTVRIGMHRARANPRNETDAHDTLHRRLGGVLPSG